MQYKKVMIAVDNSPAAERIAAEGFALGKLLNAEMALVSVVDGNSLVADSGVSAGEMAELFKNDLKKVHEMLMSGVFRDHTVWSFIEEGTPYKTILKVSEQWGADLIVMGTHGRTGLSHVLLGSVAEQVLRHAEVPVLVLPVRG